MADANLNENLNIVSESGLDIQLLDGDLNIIQKLDDEPNDVGGMTSAELKATFDKAGNIIKDYLNNQLVPAILAADATEAARAEAEAARQSAETGREQAETERVSAEEARASGEETRQSNETSRKNAETSRENAETGRASAEGQRASAEGQRASAEVSRVTAEENRVTAEQNRAKAERLRSAADRNRDIAETQRIAAEKDRASAEAARSVWEDYNADKAYVPGNKVAYEGSSYLNISACAGIEPTNTDYWLLIARKGDSGTGDGGGGDYLPIEGGILTGDLGILDGKKVLFKSVTSVDTSGNPVSYKIVAGLMIKKSLENIGTDSDGTIHAVDDISQLIFLAQAIKIAKNGDNGVPGMLMSGSRIGMLGDPVYKEDAATKQYVDGQKYTLPIASSTKLGGVQPAAKTDAMTQAVGVDDAGALWTAPGGGSVDDYADLSNKPKINGVELSGDKTSADLKIGTPSDEQVSTAVSAWLGEHPEATTTVEDGSITEAKLADGAVSAQKTDFIRFDGTSANLFNKNAVTEGYELEAYNATKVNASYCISDYIPVEAGVKYCHTYTSGRHIHYLDSTKAFISGTLVFGNFTTPANCAYIRIELPIAEKDEWMVVKGDSLPSEYIPYAEYYSVNDSVKVAVENIKDLEALFASAPDGTIPLTAMEASAQDKIYGVDNRVNTAAGWNDLLQPTKKLTGRINVFEHTVKGVFDITSDISDKTIVVHGVNYFDKNDLIRGVGVGNNGELTNNAALNITNLIPVQPGKILFYNRDKDAGKSYLNIQYYGADQKWLRVKSIGSENISGTFTPEDDVYFIRVQCGNLVDADAEKLCIADVDIGNPVYGGYDGNSSIKSGGTTYFGKNIYSPYVGYRIENGVLVGASDTYTVEEITHVDVFDSAATIEVTAPVEEEFDQKRLQNVTLKFGRHANTDYVIARIFKNTITGDTITPKVVAFSPGGKRLAEYAKEADFVMAVNAGIFDTSDNSCYGTTIVDGVVVTDHVDAGTCGMGEGLAIDASGNFSSHAYDMTISDLLSDGVVHAVHGWGAIVSDYAACDMDALTAAVSLPGSTNALFTNKHPRAAVGQYKNGDYMVFVCGGRETNQAGMTGAETQELFLSEGVKFAYMLDGGGSCNMMFFKKELAPYTENRADPSYIVFD